MEKMKSALEIAMEKLKELKKSDKNELKEVERQKYSKAAISLARSFAQGKMKKEGVRESLMRYPNQYREAALKAFFQEITENMNLLNTPAFLQAMLFLKEDENTKEFCADVEKAYQQYKQQLKNKYAELQQNATGTLLKRLASKGIKGSAIAGFNLKQLDQWQEVTLHLQENYQEYIRELTEKFYRGH